MDKTLLKGLGLLETLARSPMPRGVTELASEMGLTRSNTHRTLKTLVAAGYARQDASANYACTLKVFELANLVLGRTDVVLVAQPVIQQLAAKTQETVHLSVLDGFEVIYLQKFDSPQPVRAYTTVGGRSPAYCVATGKALLACMSPDYILPLEGRLQAFTDRTVTSIGALASELAQARRQGYAINRGEWRRSVCGLAAPILDATGQPVAAIGISGPTERLKMSRLRALSPDVLAAARRISESMGYSPTGSCEAG